MWVGVKCQSNQEIACSPRNSFRASVARCSVEVEHWMDVGARRLLTPTKLRMPPCLSAAVGLRDMRFVVERERTQTNG